MRRFLNTLFGHLLPRSGGSSSRRGERRGHLAVETLEDRLALDTTGFSGVLLWPAVVIHLLLAILLGRVWLGRETIAGKG